MEPTARRSLDALTGTRFLAAIWVVVYHYNGKFRVATAAQEQQVDMLGHPHLGTGMPPFYNGPTRHGINRLQ